MKGIVCGVLRQVGTEHLLELVLKKTCLQQGATALGLTTANEVGAAEFDRAMQFVSGRILPV